MQRHRGVIWATLLCTGLAVIVTWPQAADLGSEHAAHQDAYFSIWRLAWIAHALVTSPTHLFDANIFYPATRTLAFSDATLLQGLLGAPLFWAGLPPALTYNVLLLLGYAGSGVAMFVLARHVTGETAPSLVAAAAFTMLPYRTEHFMHLELQWAMFIPLTFWALHRAVESSSLVWGALAGVCVWLQMLACVYYGVFMAMVLPAFVLALAIINRYRPILTIAAPVAACVAVAAALTLPLAMPYRDAAEILGNRTVADISQYSATPINYFAASAFSNLWGWTAVRWGATELRLFPGAVVMLLAAVGTLRRPDRWTVVYGVTLLLAVEFSFGLNGTLYRSIVGHVDALLGLRSTSRFAIIASCALAVLAAIGAKRLLDLTGRTARVRAVTTVAIIVLMIVDCSNRPLALTTADPVEPPDLYKVIDKAAPGTVLELPLPRPDQLPGHDPQYQAWSLWHWKPLLNGYSGYYPPDYLVSIVRMNQFPWEGTLDRLRAHEVRYIVVHSALYDASTYRDLLERIEQCPELKPWGSYRDTVGMADLFELVTVD